MTTEPKVLAEQLVRRCSIELAKKLQLTFPQECDADAIILQSIPLVELLACVEVFRRQGVSCNCECSMCESVNKLNLKLKAILGEDGL